MCSGPYCLDESLTMSVSSLIKTDVVLRGDVARSLKLAVGDLQHQRVPARSPSSSPSADYQPAHFGLRDDYGSARSLSC